MFVFFVIAIFNSCFITAVTPLFVIIKYCNNFSPI